MTAASCPCQSGRRWILTSQTPRFIGGISGGDTGALYDWEAIAGRNLAIIRDNLALLGGFFARHADLFDWRQPKTGSTAFPSIRRDQNVEDFCVDMVERSGVLLLPGTCFNYGDRHFRIGYGRKNMRGAVGKLEEYLQLIVPVRDR
jgi:aspartate/methionine/tyrosine aminotransferase